VEKLNRAARARRLPVPFKIRGYSFSSTLDSFRSRVSKPSVNHPYVAACIARASSLRLVPLASRAGLVAARNSQERARCSRAISIAERKHRSARAPSDGLRARRSSPFSRCSGFGATGRRSRERVRRIPGRHGNPGVRRARSVNMNRSKMLWLLPIFALAGVHSRASTPPTRRTQAAARRIS
jgi:hypothetical protein